MKKTQTTTRPELTKDEKDDLKEHIYLIDDQFKQTIFKTSTYLDSVGLGKHLRPNNSYCYAHVFITQRPARYMHSELAPLDTAYFIYVEDYNMLYSAESLYDVWDKLKALKSWFAVEYYNEEERMKRHAEEDKLKNTVSQTPASV